MALIRFSNMATPNDTDITVKITIDIQRAEGEVSIEPLSGPKESIFVVKDGRITQMSSIQSSSERKHFDSGVFKPVLKGVDIESEMRKAGLSSTEVLVGRYLYYICVAFCQINSGNVHVPECCIGGNCVDDWADSLLTASSMKALGTAGKIADAILAVIPTIAPKDISHVVAVYDSYMRSGNIAAYIQRMNISAGMVGHELNRACNLVGAKNIFELEDKIVELL